MKPSLPQLMAFAAVYSLGSTVKASDRLGRSQSQISSDLRAVETELGIVLFRRVSGRLEPTQSAAELYGRVRRLKEAHGDIVGMGGASTKVETLLLGAPRSLSMTLLPRLVGRLHRDRPGMQIGLRFDNYSTLVAKVAEGLLDAAIVKLPITDARVSTETLCDSPMVVVMPRSHALAARPKLTPVHLSGEPLVRTGASSPSWEAVELAFADAGAQVHAPLSAGGVGPICRLVAEGLGLAIINRIMAEDYVGILNLVIRPFEPEIRDQFVIIYSPFYHRTLDLRSQLLALLNR